MNFSREYSGICVDNFNKNHLYIAGEKRSMNIVEHYDINNNEWLVLSKTLNDHLYWPILWNYEPNVIIIGSLYGWKFERNDIRENKWSHFLMSDCKSIDELFCTNIAHGNKEHRLLLSQ